MGLQVRNSPLAPLLLPIIINEVLMYSRFKCNAKGAKQNATSLVFHLSNVFLRQLHCCVDGLRIPIVTEAAVKYYRESSCCEHFEWKNSMSQ